MAGRFAPETRVRATRDIHRSQLSGTDTESHWFTVDTGHGWPDMIKLDMAPLKDVVACCDLPAESGSPPRRSDADGESHDHGLRRPACSRSGSSSQPSVGAAARGQRRGVAAGAEMSGEVRFRVSAREWMARPSVSHWRCVSPSWSPIMRRASTLTVLTAVSRARSCA